MVLPIQGVLPILHTPLTLADDIDGPTLQREIDWAFATGANGVCTAMVSEVLRLTADERIELNRMVVRMTDGRGATVASVGAESTKQAVQFAQAAADAGCDAIMAIPPVSTSLPERALWDYFAALASSVTQPLIVQDASAYVGAGISTEFSLKLLAEFGPEKILFKPEGSPVGPLISALRDGSHGQARLFDGSGGMHLIDAVRRGVTGTMPGVDLLDGIVAIWNAMARGDETAAYRVAFPLCGIVALQLQAGLDGFLAIEKYLLVRRGLFPSARRRAPFAWSVDPETAAEVDRLFEMLAEAIDVSHAGDPAEGR